MGRKKIEPLKEHSELCETRGYRTKCPECSKKYDAKKHRSNYKRLSERKKITRSVTEKKLQNMHIYFALSVKVVVMSIKTCVQPALGNIKVLYRVILGKRYKN